MPRDGSGNYTLPYPAVVDGTTIESAVHNGTMSDIALQLNGPVPIIAGGTGANNAAGARANMGAEVSAQQVTNYDSHVFEVGSFWSAPGATAAPEAVQYYSGVVHWLNSGGIIIEATAYSAAAGTGKKYRREKFGTWSAWVEQSNSVADLDARYVNLTGDTMTGALTTTSVNVSSDASAVQQFSFYDTGTGASRGSWGRAQALEVLTCSVCGRRGLAYP